MSAIQVETNETALALELTVDKLNVGGVTGLSPTVAIRNVSAGSPPSYLDWSSSTFKTSGWATKYKPMSEIERGHYQQVLDVSALSLPAGTKLSAEYHVDDGGTVKGDDADLFVFVTTGQDAVFLRKVAKNRLEEAAGNPGTLTLYDDDGTTVLETWQLRDESGGAVLPAAGTPAKRGAGSP